MQLRRVLLLIAMVLLLTAGVVAITSPRRGTDTGTGVVVPPAPPGQTAAPRSVSLAFPPPKRLPLVRLVQGDHALVRVSATQPGEAAVMGLTDTAEPGTPATFDVLAGAPARYPVTFTPTLGSARQIATVRVEP
jgi:hypothetical protein